MPQYTLSRLAWVVLVGLAKAQETTTSCTCTGLDYTNEGSYLIDGSLTSNFTFLSVFSSCAQQDACQPILLGPNNRQYPCTTINMDTTDSQQSSCGIPYFEMPSGKWSIVIQADSSDFQVIRE